MSVVLAVEPDSVLAEVLRKALRRIDAELLVVSTTGEAIGAMRRSVPDLVLVSALLSPRDEDALFAHLRTLEASSHLQTLTIPQLRRGKDSSKKGAALFRKKDTAAESGGCDPAVFAHEVRAYLTRAREMQAQAADMALAHAGAPLIAPRPAGIQTFQADPPPVRLPPDATQIPPEPTFDRLNTTSHSGLAPDPTTNLGLAADAPARGFGLAPDRTAGLGLAPDPTFLHSVQDSVLNTPTWSPAPSVPLVEEPAVPVQVDSENSWVDLNVDAFVPPPIEPEPAEPRLSPEEVQSKLSKEIQRFETQAEQRREAELLRAQEEAQARLRAEVARVQAEAEARRQHEVARLQAEAEARRQDEVARVQAEAEAQRQAAVQAARAAEAEARHALTAELEKVRANTKAGQRREAELLRAQEEAQARLTAEVERVQAEAEARRQHELARVQAEAEAQRKAAVQEARAAAEAEARNALTAELEKVRVNEIARVQAEADTRVDAAAKQAREAAEAEASRAMAEELSRIRAQVEQTLNTQLEQARAEADRLREAERARAQTEAAKLRNTAAEEARLTAEANASRALEAEVARVRAEAEAQLRTELNTIRQENEHLRKADQSEAKQAAEKVRAAAIRDARAIAEAANHTLEAELARVRAEADARLEAEVARARAQAEQQRTTEMQEIRAQVAGMRETASQQARRAAAEAIALEVVRGFPEPAPHPVAVAPLALQTFSTPPLAPVLPKAVEAEPIAAATAHSKASSSDYYRLWKPKPHSPAEAPGEEEEEQTIATRAVAFIRSKWALPVAAGLLLVVGNTMSGGWSWGSHPAKPAPAPAVKPTVQRPAPRVVVDDATGKTGSIDVQTDPAGARVLVDGTAAGETPILLSKLKPGKHTLVFESRTGTMTKRVTVRAGETLRVSESIFSGWLAVFAGIPLQLYIGGQLRGTTEDGQLMLTPGTYDVELVSERFNFRQTKNFTIEPGKVASYTVSLPFSTIRVNAADGTDIAVDGRPAGKTPLGDYPVVIGTHQLTATGTALGDRRLSIEVKLGEPTEVLLR